MKTLKIVVPDRLTKRPRDPRGLVIPYTVVMTKNGPDFATTDEAARREVIAKQWCALCAQPLDGKIYFIGGDKAHASRCFIDPGMHGLCARYAIQACPFLRGDLTDHRDTSLAMKDESLRVVVVGEETMVRGRPPRMGLFCTRSYEPVIINRNLLVRAGKWVTVEWF